MQIETLHLVCVLSSAHMFQLPWHCTDTIEVFFQRIAYFYCAIGASSVMSLLEGGGGVKASPLKIDRHSPGLI